MRLRSVLAVLLLAAACAHASPSDSEAITALYPEGPLWQGERLYYAEMGADRVSAYENGERRTFFRQTGCGPTAIAPYGEGFLILCHIGARIVAVDARGREVRRWDRDDAGNRLQDPNDASADGSGGVYFSDPGLFTQRARAHGYVMHLSADGVLRRVAGPLRYPNGVFVDQPRRQVYVTEHMEGRILRYEITANGAIADPRTFFALSDAPPVTRFESPYAESGPDGIEIAPNGDFYVAIYGQGRLLQLSSDGRYLGQIETPARYVTNMAFRPSGAFATTGSFQNIEPPYPGEVRFYAPERLTQPAD